MGGLENNFSKSFEKLREVILEIYSHIFLIAFHTVITEIYHKWQIFCMLAINLVIERLPRAIWPIFSSFFIFYCDAVISLAKNCREIRS